MPLPKPRINESEKDFIDRCIIDAVVQNEFPELDQRIAVCNNLYRPSTKAAKFDSQRFMFGLERKRDVQERNWSRQFSRFYLHEYFPGYENYFWLDSDTWINCPETFEYYLKGVNEKGFAICPQIDRSSPRLLNIKWLLNFPYKINSINYKNISKI